MCLGLKSFALRLPEPLIIAFVAKLPKTPLSNPRSWCTDDREFTYVSTVEILSFLNRVAQLMYSHRVVWERGHDSLDLVLASKEWRLFQADS